MISMLKVMLSYTIERYTEHYVYNFNPVHGPGQRAMSASRVARSALTSASSSAGGGASLRTSSVSDDRTSGPCASTSSASHRK